MPEQDTIQKAQRDAEEGKSPLTQAGEFIREQIHHIRDGLYGARSPEQAIAIGLSEARRAGVEVPVPPAGQGSPAARKQAKRDLAKGKTPHKTSRKRSRAATKALRKESGRAASKRALSAHAKAAARRRGPAKLAAAAKRAAKTRQRGKR
jgi:hypothetical protein